MQCAPKAPSAFAAARANRLAISTAATPCSGRVPGQFFAFAESNGDERLVMLEIDDNVAMLAREKRNEYMP
jgi:hypothetical protein